MSVPGTGTGCDPQTTRPLERCSVLFILPTWKSEPSKASLEAERPQGSRQLLTGPAFPPGLPPGGDCRSRAQLRQARKTCFLCWELPPISAGGQEGPQSRAGAPILSATLAEGQRPPSTHLPRPGQSLGPLTQRGSRNAGAEVGDSNPHPPPCVQAPWWLWGDGSTPWETAPPPAAFPRSESPLTQNT